MHLVIRVREIVGERKEIERERKRASRGLVIGCLLLLGSARFRLERVSERESLYWELPSAKYREIKEKISKNGQPKDSDSKGYQLSRKKKPLMPNLGTTFLSQPIQITAQDQLV